MKAVFWIIFAIATLFILPVAHAAVSCNDIELSPNDVTFTEGQTNRVITFTLSNDSTADFDIDDVRVSESDARFDVEVVRFDDELEEDGTARVRIQYDTDDVQNDVETSFTLSVRGEFSNGHDCSFSQINFSVDVTIEDGENACTLIEAESSDVTIDEDDTQSHFVLIRNDSDRDFEITDFDVFDDSTAFNADLEVEVNDSDFEKIVPHNSSRSYELSIRSFRVDEVEVDSAFVEIQGHFIGGTGLNSCDNTEISTDFEVEVLDTGSSGLCGEIKIAPTRLRVESQNTIVQNITISNTGEQNYFIDELEVRDNNYQVQFDALDLPDKVDVDGSQDVEISAQGFLYPENFDANAFFYLKGHFTSGRACSVSGLRMPFTFQGSPTTGGSSGGAVAPSDASPVLYGNAHILENNLQINPRTEGELGFTLVNEDASDTLVRITLIAKPSNARFTNTVHLLAKDRVEVFVPTTILRGQSDGIIVVDNGSDIVSKPVALINSAPATNSPQSLGSGIVGFVTGSGSIAIGLIVLLLVIIYLAVGMNEVEPKKPENWQAETVAIVKTLPSEPAEEPWMHPKKE
ncbi:MAG: hypothetical protein IPJ89_01760 [Candidatus Iainarchaeum archaeon]|uniref:Uncharacterized protein n=1 Tax=Candidatus Iainarchaeum sp. TaxID=3101447 RepID=A0A7T9DKF8_9ARCH|nr:MAG: hypothetical protein IPJ89_01760 [Candidatus Diapherotrites archaeon]